MNVKGLDPQKVGPTVVYCGRSFQGWVGHPLANPFKLEDFGGNRELVLAKYREWLLARPTLEADLAALWAQSGNGLRPLACWCAPLACHGNVLAELLEERFG